MLEGVTAAQARYRPPGLDKQQVCEGCGVQQDMVPSSGLLSAAPSFTIKTMVLPKQQQTAVQQPRRQEGQMVEHKLQQYYANQPQQLLATGSGNWLSHLNFGDQRYWTLSEDKPEQWVLLHQVQQQKQQEPQQQRQPLQQQQGHDAHKLWSCNVLLPSDSQLRADLVAFRDNDPQAQKMKEQLEHQQRRDAKIRPSFPHIDCAQAD